MESLDPRVKRLPKIGVPGQPEPKAPLDQFGTFEVFVQPKEGKPFQHEGAVHAPNREMAFVLAKETFTRRFTCISLFVVDTRQVFVSPMTEGGVSAYDQLPPDKPEGNHIQYEVFHLMKRGKQHTHVGNVTAPTPLSAMHKAKAAFRPDKPVYNIWIVPSQEIRFTLEEEKDLWITLPEKKFRDASDYKGGDKLKEFLEQTR